MGLKKWWANFTNSQERSPNTNQPQRRRYIEDVKIGEWIYVEWYRIEGKIGQMKCLNNDPLTKKILLEVVWSNRNNEKQRVIFDYSGFELENFHLLNPFKEKKSEKIDDTDIASLQKRMNDALEKEEYEIAREIQNKIDKLLKS